MKILLLQFIKQNALYFNAIFSNLVLKRKQKFATKHKISKVILMLVIMQNFITPLNNLQNVRVANYPSWQQISLHSQILC